MTLLDHIRQDKFIAVDLETNGLNPRKNSVISFAGYYPEGSIYTKDLDVFLSWLSDFSNHALVFHNANFDLSFFNQLNITLKNPIIDTLILAQLVDENRPLGLKELSENYFGKESIIQYLDARTYLSAHNYKPTHYWKLPEDLLREYNLEDVKNTYKLVKTLVSEMDKKDVMSRKHFPHNKTSSDYYEEESQPIERVLLKMSSRGCKIDLEKVEIKRKNTEKEIKIVLSQLETINKQPIDDIEAELFSLDKKFKGFNWNSGFHLGKLLFQHYSADELVDAKTHTGRWSTSLTTIEKIKSLASDPILKQTCQLLIEYSDLRKKMTTSIGTKDGHGLLSRIENERLYSSFKQVGGEEDRAKGTITGRLSSSPNVQNLQDFEKSFYVPG